MKPHICKITLPLKRALAFCLRHTGLNIVYLGVLLLAVFYFCGITNYNVLLYIPMLLIVLGIIGFVHNEKAKQSY